MKFFIQAVTILITYKKQKGTMQHEINAPFKL